MTTRSSKRRLVTALLAAAVVVAGPAAARAQGAADVESAKVLYKEGKELRDKGDLVGSLDKLRAAHALAATPVTATELGRAYELTGRLLDAFEAYTEAARMPARPGESPKAVAARAEAVKLRDGVKARIPSLTFQVTPANPDGLDVTMDGVRLPLEALAAPRKVNPGTHEIVALAPGMRGRATVTVVEGEQRAVALTLEALAPPPPVVATPADSAPPVVTSNQYEQRGRSPFLYSGLVIAGVGVVVGATTGAIALSKAASIKDSCVDGRCPPEAHDDLRASKSMATVSTIGFGVAAAGAVLAMVGWAMGPSREASPRASAWISPAFGPAVAGVTGGFP